MATLDKDVLKERKRKKFLLILVSWILWLLVSIYLAYFLDQLCQAVMQGRTIHRGWELLTILRMYKNNPGVWMWYLVLQLTFLGITVFILLEPTSHLKDIHTIQITDDIFIPKAVGNGQHGNARFSNPTEFKQMFSVFTFSGKEELTGFGGLVVDMQREQGKEVIRYVGENVHSLILGSTGSGKTRRILLLTLWLQMMSEKSVVISDVKGEIYYYTSQYARDKDYETLVFDLRNPNKSMRYNFLQPILDALEREDQSQAIDYTWDLVSVLVGEQKGDYQYGCCIIRPVA